MDVEKIVRENIDRTFHLSLSTSKDNIPWITEVHFAYDDKLNLYFRSLSSRRHSIEIENNPRVAGNIMDKYALSEDCIGVYFEGIANKLDNKPEIQTAFQAIKSRLHTDESILDEATNPSGHQFYKIKVTQWHIFGNFENNMPKKYSLEVK